jgi:hypothetical protein
MVASVEQLLEGHIIEKTIQEAQVKQQVEVSRFKLKAFEAALSRLE